MPVLSFPQDRRRVRGRVVLNGKHKGLPPQRGGVFPLRVGIRVLLLFALVPPFLLVLGSLLLGLIVVIVLVVSEINGGPWPHYHQDIVKSVRRQGKDEVSTVIAVQIRVGSLRRRSYHDCGHSSFRIHCSAYEQWRRSVHTCAISPSRSAYSLWSGLGRRTPARPYGTARAPSTSPGGCCREEAPPDRAGVGLLLRSSAGHGSSVFARPSHLPRAPQVHRTLFYFHNFNFCILFS